MVDPVLAGVGLRRCYGPVVALDAVDVEAWPGALTAVRGPSGSGKSTLARLLACTERPDAGEVRLEGSRVDDASSRRRRALRRHRVAVVAAEPTANLLAGLDAAGNLRAIARWRGVDVDVEGALDAVGLHGRARAAVPDLSGGEQQRLGVAVAAVGAPAVVVADEPTAELDADAAVLVVGLLAGLARTGTAVLVATHDPVVVAAADVVVELEHGRRR